MSKDEKTARGLLMDLGLADSPENMVMLVAAVGSRSSAGYAQALKDAADELVEAAEDILDGKITKRNGETLRECLARHGSRYERLSAALQPWIKGKGKDDGSLFVPK